MKWKKLGKIYDPENVILTIGDFGYGANPIAQHICDDKFRIFYNVRNKDNQSSITWLDFDLANRKIISLGNKILVAPGERGYFDESGCSLGCVLDISQEEKYIYYLGWSVSKTTPFRNFIGLSVLNNKSGECEKYSLAPIVDRNEIDPLSISYPFVMKKDNVFKMWYGSHLKWGEEFGGMVHFLKYAESDDAIHWKRTGEICIAGKDESEYAFSRPCVIFEDDIYKMWYSYRGHRYKIGYAESKDGINWIRDDEKLGLVTSETGWDSEMVDYPFVFDHKGERYMLYCGNGFGRTGFGLAVLEED